MLVRWVNVIRLKFELIKYVNFKLYIVVKYKQNNKIISTMTHKNWHGQANSKPSSSGIAKHNSLLIIGITTIQTLQKKKQKNKNQNKKQKTKTKTKPLKHKLRDSTPNTLKGVLKLTHQAKLNLHLSHKTKLCS